MSTLLPAALFRDITVFNSDLPGAPDVHMAALDKTGVIVSVNQAWEQFAHMNGELPLEHTWIGVNYLELCRAAVQQGDTLAQQALEGIEAALSGAQTQHTFEYSCPTAAEERWYRLAISVLNGAERCIIVTHEDITARKRIHQTLDESEERFRLLAENANDTIYRYCFVPEQKFEYISPSVTLMTGYTPKEFYSDPELAVRMIHEADRSLFKAYVQTVDPFSDPLVLRWICKDGATLWVEQHMAPVSDSAGNLIAIEGSVRDITERKRTEESLRESEQRFRQAYLHAPIGMALVGMDGRWLQVNHALAAMTGYSEAEMVTTTFQALTHPDDLEKSIDHVRRLAAGEVESYQLEKRYFHKSGKIIWVLLSVSLLRNAQNEPLYLIAQAQDITLRRLHDQAQTRLAAIVDSSDDAIIGKALDGAIVSWNAGAERLYGYVAEEVIGQRATFLTLNDYEEEQAHILERIKRGEQIKHYETTRIHKDGWHIDVSHTISPIRDAAGELIGISIIARDITERKRAEESLRRQTAFVQLLGIIAVAANQAASLKAVLQTTLNQICQRLGWPIGHVYLVPEDNPTLLLSTKIWFLADAKRFALFRKITEAVDIAGGDDFPRPVLASGKPEWIVDMSAAPGGSRTELISESGVRSGFAFPVLVGAEIVAVLEFFSSEMVARDQALLDVMAHIGTQLGRVAERTRAEAALRASEEHYRLIAENTGDIITLTDLEGRFCYVSPSCRNLLGYEPSALIGRSALDHMHPHDLRILANEWQEMRSWNSGRASLRYRHTNGDWRWFDAHGTLITLKNNRYIVGVSRDITEYRRTEEALEASNRLYRTLARNFPNGAVFLFDHDLCYTIADGAGLADLNLSREAVEGRTIWEVYQPEIYAMLEPLYRAALSGRPSIEEMRYQERVYVIHTIPVRNESNDIIAGIAMIQDITERKRVEESLVDERAMLARRVEERTADLSAANAELARTARLKDEFLANMSHELRTPLNAVLGLSEALHEEVYGSLNERQKKTLWNIKESGQHLLDLINDILDLAKIGANKMDLEIEPILVEHVCQASLRLIQQTAHKKQISVEMHIDPAVKMIHADTRRLKQILVNLLSNAVKFTPTGGAVGLVVTGDEIAHAVHFTIWDTGIGIAQHQMKLLFQPFVQIDSRLARQYEGTGLGLALVYRMVEMHGGSLSVSSEPEVGSRFTVSLPWNKSDPGIALPAQLAQPARQTLSTVHTALIIEDSPSTAEQLRRYLSECGIASVVQPCGANAAAQAIVSDADLVVLDILLPDMSGWNVLSQLKADQRTQDIPVIIMSVVDESHRGAELGVFDYWVKPLTRYGVQQSLQRLLFNDSQNAPAGAQPLPLPALPISDVVLIAEDNESNITMLSDYLNTIGYRVVATRNGAEAVARAREVQPALILMDIQMPGMDGLEATRRIRACAELAETPIIALTALAMPGDRQRCFEAGANEYLSKPVSLKMLAAVIQSHLR